MGKNLSVILSVSLILVGSIAAFASKCVVVADGAYIPKGSYVEFDAKGPSLTFFYAYEKPDQTTGFIRIFLVGETFVSSWGLPRTEPYCKEITAQASGFKFDYICKDIAQYAEVSGGLNFDATTNKGHYQQFGLETVGTKNSLEFDFEQCQDTKPNKL